jgi:hypothetical protein
MDSLTGGLVFAVSELFSSSSPSSQSSKQSSHDSHDSSTPSSWLIVGSIIGGTVVIGIIVGCVVWRCTGDGMISHDDASIAAAATVASVGMIDPHHQNHLDDDQHLINDTINNTDIVATTKTDDTPFRHSSNSDNMSNAMESLHSRTAPHHSEDALAVNEKSQQQRPQSVLTAHIDHVHDE